MRSTAEDRQEARIRDIPKSCTCLWILRYNPVRYRMQEQRWECPWHGEAGA